jgi:8-oxo-dGTP pyrophosphatase MutT (NUDIX family)
MNKFDDKDMNKNHHTMLHIHRLESPQANNNCFHRAFHSLCRKRTPKRMDMTHDIKVEPRAKIYGGIICAYDDGKKEYALVQGRHTGKWSFPKGHSNEGETPMECTKREIWEETGIDNLPDPIEYLKVGYGYYYLFVVPMKFHLYPHDTNEIMKTAWVSMEEMAAMSLNADVNQYIRNEKRNRTSLNSVAIA